MGYKENELVMGNATIRNNRYVMLLFIILHEINILPVKNYFILQHLKNICYGMKKSHKSNDLIR